MSKKLLSDGFEWDKTCNFTKEFVKNYKQNEILGQEIFMVA